MENPEELTGDILEKHGDRSIVDLQGQQALMKVRHGHAVMVARHSEPDGSEGKAVSLMIAEGSRFEDGLICVRLDPDQARAIAETLNEQAALVAAELP